MGELHPLLPIGSTTGYQKLIPKFLGLPVSLNAVYLVTLNFLSVETIPLDWAQQSPHLLLSLECTLSSVCCLTFVPLQSWRTGSESLTRVTEGLSSQSEMGPCLAGLALTSKIFPHPDQGSPPHLPGSLAQADM